MSIELSGYKLLDHLHTSRHSTVHRARRVADDSPVVVKASTPEVAPEQALARLQHELDVLRSIESDAVVGAYEIARQGDTVALVMEDFGGQSLSRFMAEHRLRLPEALDIAIQAAGALQTVHDAGVFHRDVNPNNIVYNRADRVLKLIDFDLSSHTRAGLQRFAAPHAIEGTLLYMAPEQTGRINRTADHRSDLYSLGMTLYELFTGRLPHSSSDPLSIVHFHVAVQPTPPEDVEPEVPPVISDIVMRLLAKAPESRYQTAAGLKADLEASARQLSQTGRVERFPLGEVDRSDRFEVCAVLYGREEPSRALLDCFDRIAHGGVEKVRVHGPSGAGKTSLVRELRASLSGGPACFAAGKFDQVRREVPYSALVGAFEDLAWQLLSEDEAQLARWREQILRATQPNARIVVEAIPAMELVIGPQPPLPPLDPAATQNRFHLTLQRFIQVFTRRAHPLVLFVDDVQWADAASAALLDHVATSDQTESLLLIEALRDGELPPLAPAPAEEARRGRRMSSIGLAPLESDHVAQLLADSLRRPREEVADLARVVGRKTEGNPLFIRQFLEAVHVEGHIRFDAAANSFAFDLASIERVPVTENVAGLLARRFGHLPRETRRLLTAAAVAGGTFDAAVLAAVGDLPLAAVHEALVPALRDDFIAPVSDGAYAFQHDRIQQAAHAAAAPEEHAPLHLAIGRALLARAADDVEDRIFDICRHLNRAVSLIADAGERARLAGLNLVAGARARGTAAYAIAAASFRAAAELSGSAGDDRACCRALLGLAESLYLATDFTGALEALDLAVPHVRARCERGEIEALRVTIHLHMGDVRGALACGRRASALLGYELPADPAEVGRRLGEELAAILHRIEREPIERFADLPEMRDPDQLALMAFLMSCVPPAYMVEPPLMALICARSVALSLEHGNSPLAPPAYSSFAIVLHAMGRERDGYRFGALGLDLCRRLGSVAQPARVRLVFGAFSSPWGQPLEESIRHMRDGVQLGLDIGDYVHGAYCAVFAGMHALFRGLPLAELAAAAERNRKLAIEVGEVITARMLSSQLQLIRSYRGELADDAVLDGDGFSEEAVLQAARSTGNLAHEFWMRLVQIEHRLAAGRQREAFEIARAAEPLLAAVPSSLGGPQHHLYQSLAAAALWEDAPAERAELTAVLERNQARMKRWSELCPENFRAPYLLVEAERARTGSTGGNPVDLYDEAITAAAQDRSLRLEALANELAGAFWLERKRRLIAMSYLRRARDLYSHWGATRKVDQLERTKLGSSRETAVLATAAHALDLASVVRASQAVSAEIVLERLLGSMLDIMLQNAGAQGGALLLGGGSELLIQAQRQPDTSRTSVMEGLSLSHAAWPPQAIVRYAMRTGDSLVLDDATRDPKFASDERVAVGQPRSVLCTPMRHKGKPIGALYLENNLVCGAFTRAHLEALNILVSQLAVSIENAALFARQKEQAEALAQVNAGLRSEIAEREKAERELATYRDRLQELVAERTRELEESREQYRLIAESTNAVPFTYAPDRDCFIYVGPQGEKRLGFASRRWREPGLLDEILPRGQSDAARERLAAITVGQELELECAARAADGRSLQLRWVVACGDVRGERYVRGLILDVTERWRLESELGQAQKLESVGRLAAGVAHEINTPVQFVSDSVHFVRGAMTDLIEVLRRYQDLGRAVADSRDPAPAAREALAAEDENDIDYIVEQAPGALDRALDGLQRVTTIVRAMKDFAHPEQKEKSPVDLNQAVQSTLIIARNEYKYVAELETEYGDIPLVRCHAGEINQVVLNIVVNAAHAIADAVSGTEDRGRIAVRTRRDGDVVEISVGDTGRGIPEELRQRVFEPFFTTKGVGKGTGQGLAIARNVIVEKHGGTLTFDSEPGRGTTFYVRIPIG